VITAVRSAAATDTARRGGGAWIAPALLLLAVIPLAAGTARVVQLLGGPDAIPADGRFDASPVPVVVHVVGSAVFLVLGALQFWPRLRSRHGRWHRTAGRILVVTGLAVAGSAIWMTLLLDRKEGTGQLLWLLRLLVAPGMAGCLLLGLAAARERRFRAHAAWMRRTYALALGAGTQPFTVGLGEALLGSGVVRTDVMLGAGWGLNLAVAEWLNARVRRREPVSSADPDGGIDCSATA
jgi:uncharacterized membrane protein